MTKAEKQKYLEKKYIGYYSGWSGIEIKDIQYGIDDYIIFVAGAWCGNKSVHRSKVYYTVGLKSPYGDARAYFRYNGNRIYLDECIRAGI